jgi:hypothetical protein
MDAQTEKEERPLLYKVALDILPIQATSVPCEQSFSSSKETITPRRNRMEPELMEQLQILKYIYRHDKLNPMAAQYMTETELADEQDDVAPELVDQLIASGRITELTDVISPGFHAAVDRSLTSV